MFFNRPVVKLQEQLLERSFMQLLSFKSLTNRFHK